MAQVSYPGVYIEEFAPAPPIQPASTSIAGFVGYARKGKVNSPTRITNFAQFKKAFGDRPVSGFFLWYAVRGFFENGGTDCFVVRASNGEPAKWVLSNSEQEEVVYAFSRTLGQSDIQISLELHPGLQLTVLTAESTVHPASSGRKLSVAETGNFRAGDVIKVDSTRATITSVAENELILDRPITAADGVAVKLADPQPGESAIRFVDDAGMIDKLPSGAFGTGTVIELNGEHLVIESVQKEYLSKNRIGFKVTFNDGVSKSIDRQNVGLAVIKLVKLQIGEKSYEWLGTEASHARYIVKHVNERDETLELRASDVPPLGGPDARIPTGSPARVEPGSDENTTNLKKEASPLKIALDSLRRISEVNLVCMPDAVAITVDDSKKSLQQALISHCELLGDRFAVLDPLSANLKMFGETNVETQRAAVESARGYAALYYPWLNVTSASSSEIRPVPPCGHVAGLIARIDKSRGVHKAPAGTEATLNDAVSVTQDMTNDEQGILNLGGINVIRTFKQGGRPTVFGGRTTASDINWQYVNIRRLFLFLEESIAAGLKSSVFEPNNQSLWGALKRVVTAFLTEQWRAGALFGNTAEEAFYVKIDETLNPFNERALGKLTLEIGVSPSYPAEFIVVRIGIWDGGMEMSEG